jgi:hypothetical protein
MPEYRFYTMKPDGTAAVAAPIEYDLPDDAAALGEAKKLLDGHNIEVWQGTRKVRVLDHKD